MASKQSKQQLDRLDRVSAYLEAESGRCDAHSYAIKLIVEEIREMRANIKALMAIEKGKWESVKGLFKKS